MQTHYNSDSYEHLLAIRLRRTCSMIGGKLKQSDIWVSRVLEC
jgi:hypothetical protein